MSSAGLLQLGICFTVALALIWVPLLVSITRRRKAYRGPASIDTDRDAR